MSLRCGPAVMAGAALFLALSARAQPEEGEGGGPHSLLPPSPPVTATPLAPPPGTADESTPPSAPPSISPPASPAAPSPFLAAPQNPPAAQAPSAGPSPPPPASPPAGSSPSAPAAAGGGTPLPSSGTPPAAAPSSPSSPPAASPSPVLLPPDWEPRKSADLLVLDALAGQARHVEVRVGESVQVGTLSVTVPACLSRPASEARDDAALLVVTEKGAPLFQGWMFSNEPALGTLEHPIYDIRLTACH